MLMKMKPMRAGVGSALLACGAAGLLAVTGCSSGGTSSSASGSGTPVAARASADATPSNAMPSWAAALGSGMTVVPPGAAAPGHGSPGAVLAGLIVAVKDEGASVYCGYAEPSAQAQCKSALAKVSASEFPSIKNGALGYIVIDGDKAVAGMTGTECVSGQTDCTTNQNPAAIFTTVHTFSKLWKNAITNSGGTYSLTPLTKIGGNWYVYSAS
jgi:hypothetical protein